MWNCGWTDQPATAELCRALLLPRLLCSALPAISASSTTSTKHPSSTRRAPNSPPPAQTSPSPAAAPAPTAASPASAAPRGSSPRLLAGTQGLQIRRAIPSPSFPGGDDCASGVAICPVVAQPFAGDERILQVCPPLLFPSAMRNGAPKPLYSDLNPVTMYYLLTSISFA